MTVTDRLAMTFDWVKAISVVIVVVMRRGEGWKGSEWVEEGAGGCGGGRCRGWARGWDFY